MTLMLLPDLPKGVRPLVTPIVDTADAAFVMSLDCQFLAWGSRAQQLFGFSLPMSWAGIATMCWANPPQANACAA